MAGARYGEWGRGHKLPAPGMLGFESPIARRRRKAQSQGIYAPCNVLRPFMAERAPLANSSRLR